jgi:transglutaminase-like putative cysteine protease
MVSEFPGRGALGALVRRSLSAAAVRVKGGGFTVVRAHLSGRRPPLLFRLVGRLVTRDERTAADKLDALFGFVRGCKGTAVMERWPLPLEALVLPRLDCKGLSTLFVLLARGAGLRAELVIGVDRKAMRAHAWAEAETEDGRTAYDFLQDAPVSVGRHEAGGLCSLWKKG